MWTEQKIEKHLKEILTSEFEAKAEDYISLYITARKYIIEEVLKEIKGIEPSLTDHSADHVANVMERAWDLIEDQQDRFSGIEIYLLCLIILFHDVGNIEGRGGHNKKIAEIYNNIRNKVPTYNQERRLVLIATAAHCGSSKKGDKDTLSDVDEISNLYNKEIKLRELASILRFADELSEGPQRTSHYLNSKSKIAEDAQIYHEYASITNIFVDKGNNRIATTYNIDYTSSERIEELLEFTYRRILKLDAERRYCKYYAPILDKLKKTDAQINFTINGDICDLDLPKIELGDKYNLIDDGNDTNIVDHFIKNNPVFNIHNIVEKLNSNKDE